MSEDNNEQRNEQQGPPKSVAREYFESFVVTLIMAIFGMTFVLQAVTVPTGSMQNTILIGDYLLVNKFIFAPGGKPLPLLPQREIERGDIIVFKYPGFPDNTRKVTDRGGTPYQINFVKRVIGLPGDTIELKDNQVFINGEVLPEHRMVGDKETEDAALTAKEFEPREPADRWEAYYSELALEGLSDESRYDFAGAGSPYTVPENSYFVLGDSRNESLDSRFWGVVSRDLVVGRAMFVYWSCDREASNGGFFGCLTHPRLDRIGRMIR
jgi:signal peptidase I